MKPAHAMLMLTPDRKLFGQVVRVLMLCLCRNYLFSCRQSHTTEEAQTELFDAKLRHFSEGRVGLILVRLSLTISLLFLSTWHVAHLWRAVSIAQT